MSVHRQARSHHIRLVVNHHFAFIICGLAYVLIPVPNADCVFFSFSFSFHVSASSWPRSPMCTYHMTTVSHTFLIVYHWRKKDLKIEFILPSRRQKFTETILNWSWLFIHKHAIYFRYNTIEHKLLSLISPIDLIGCRQKKSSEEAWPDWNWIINILYIIRLS